MKKNQILEAWRNEEYYLGLSEEERAAIPEHPAGILDVADDVLRSITGGCALTAKGGCPTSACCTPCTPYVCTICE